MISSIIGPGINHREFTQSNMHTTLVRWSISMRFLDSITRIQMCVRSSAVSYTISL